jgi:outer membrane receptor for ferrienterochelin and colicin
MPIVPSARSAVFALLLIACASTSAHAQAVTPDTAARSLGAVVISATRASTTTERVALHATVIGRAEIMKAPAQTLDQLLRDVPGINMPGAPFFTTDPTAQQTKMRGVTNSKVLVLVDGIPVHDPFYTTTQWFKVPLSSIERVEVLRGGSSSLWGNLAVAGVVNIITRKPIDASTQADVTYQSMNTTTAAVAKNFTFGSVLSLRVSGDVLRTDGYQTTPEAFLNAMPGKTTSSATNKNAQVAAYFTPGGSVSGFLRAGYHEQNEDIGGYRYGTNLQKSPDAAAGLTKYFGDDARAELRAWTQSVSFDKLNGGGCYLAAAGNCNTTSAAAPVVQYAISHDDNPYHELGASAIVSTGDIAAVRGNAELGFDYRGVSGEDRATVFNRPTTADIASSTINRTARGRGTQSFAGAFGQLHVSPVTRLDATASLRVDHWSNTGGVAELTRYTNGSPGTTLGGSIDNSNQTSINPALSARLRATDALSFRGATYRSFRAPGLNNLYRSFASTTFITIANPLLQPETLTGGEVGADWRLARFTAGATWFQYDTKNLIASYKIPNAAAAPAAVTAICGPTLSNCPATVNFNTNGQNAVSRGLELVSTWRASNTLSMDAGYTHTNSHYTSTTTGDPIDAQLGAIPVNVGNAGVTWQITPRWSTYTSARYNGAMFLDVNHTIPQRGFTLVNFSASFRASKQIEVYGSVTNLTDEHYADNATTTASGQTLGLLRSFTSGVRLRF